MGRAAAKEGAGQDLPEPLGPAASQTLDPRAGTPDVATSSGPDLTTRERLCNLILRIRTAALCARSVVTIARVWRAGKRWYPAPDFRAEWHTLQACAVKFFASIAASATRASGTELSQVLRIFPPTNTDLWAQKILASSTNIEAATGHVRYGISLIFKLTARRGSRAIRPNVGMGRREGEGWSGHA